MNIDPQQLQAAVERNDAARVRELLRDATEADRRACAKALKRLLDGPEFVLPQPIWFQSADDFTTFLSARMTDHDQWHAERSARERERDEWSEMSRGAAFLAAELGLAGGLAAAVRAADGRDCLERPAEEELDAVAGVLADRHPDWLADFADRLLGAEYEWRVGAWPLARALVRLGAIDPPGSPVYATKMPAAVYRGQWTEQGGWRLPLDALLADPGLLDDEVWRLFTVADAAREVERHGGSCWSDALALLSERGRLDRGRLLDACLDAFTRNFAPNRVGWYASVHDRMSASLDEMAARAGRYLGLLAVRSKPGVTVGQRGCGVLLDAGRLAPERFLAASGPALLFPQKSTATAQLKLIGKVAAKSPEARALAVTTAAQAFAHQREDVQEAALALIAEHRVPDGQQRAVISELAGALSPILASDAAALGLAPAPRPTARELRAAGDTQSAAPNTAAAQRHAALNAALTGQPAEPTAELDELEQRIHALPASLASGLRPALAAARRGEVPGPGRAGPSAGRALPEPLDDPEELVQLLTQLMEDASDALAVERALAGAVRLAALPAHDRARLAAPLLKRAEKRAREDYDGPFSGREITADMACLVLAWGSGWSVDIDRTYRGHRGHRLWWGQAREAVRRSGEARTMAGILSARVWEASTLINSGRPVRLLAEPEFERGAIGPDRLLDRLTCWAGFPAARLPRHDLEMALLRLAPGAGDAFWSAWARVHPTTARAARRAHAGGLAPLSFEPVVAQPAGGPRSHGYPHWHRHVLARIAGPCADSAGHAGSRCWTLLTALASPLRDHHSYYGQRQVNTHYDPVVAAWPLLCPWQPELAAAHLLRPLSDGLKPGSSPAPTAVGCLSSPGHALGMIGHLALVTGLASAEPDARITAAEVWSQASLDGRLDPELAASAIVTGVTGGAVKLSRIADGLQHASQEPIAGFRIIETVFAAAGALIPAKPANLHLLFELAARIGTAAGTPELPGAITGLAAQKASSRLAAASRRIVKDCGGPAPARGQAIAQALAALTARDEPQALRSLRMSATPPFAPAPRDP